MFLDIVMGRKNQVGLALTPQAVAVIDELAEQTQLSRAEVVEAIAQARIQLLAEGAEWVFRLQPGDAQTQVTALDPHPPEHSPAESAPESVPESAPAVDASTIAELAAAVAREQEAIALSGRLQAEVATLQLQLAEARSHRQQLQAQLQEQVQTAPPTPAPEPITEPPVPTPVPVNFLPADVLKGLQEQLLNTRAAYMELETQLKQQQAENDRLQQALVEAQQLASIGSSQLNRWQYKTFSR